MSKSFITTYSEDELRQIVKGCMQDVLRGHTPSPSGPESEIMDVRQAAKLTGLSVQTLYGKTSRREIPHFKRGKRIYFQPNELIKWIRKGKVKTREELESETYSDLQSDSRH